MQDEVEVKARELLAAEIRRGGKFDVFMGPHIASEAALRAIAAALRQRPCCVCGAMVDTRENGTPGAELTEGKLACSEACWDRAAAESERPVVDDAVRKDAERYRWLRDLPEGSVHEQIGNFPGFMWDEAIDAAIAACQQDNGGK